MRRGAWAAAVVVTVAVFGPTVITQNQAGQNPAAGTAVKSVGRGAPVVYARDFQPVGPNAFGARGRGGGRGGEVIFNGSARNGATPPGIEPLKIDIFTSKDFYKDQRTLERQALLPLQQRCGARSPVGRQRRQRSSAPTGRPRRRGDIATAICRARLS